MIFRPKWVESLPPNLRPDERRICELEQLRAAFGIPHEALAMRIISSRATTRKVQRQCLEALRVKNPELSEKELFRMVLVSRKQGGDMYGVPGMTEQQMDEAMRHIDSFDDLCDCIISMEDQEPSFPDPLGIGEHIDRILEQEEGLRGHHTD